MTIDQLMKGSDFHRVERIGNKRSRYGLPMTLRNAGNNSTPLCMLRSRAPPKTVTRFGRVRALRTQKADGTWPSSPPLIEGDLQPAAKVHSGICLPCAMARSVSAR